MDLDVVEALGVKLTEACREESHINHLIRKLSSVNAVLQYSHKTALKEVDQYVEKMYELLKTFRHEMREEIRHLYDKKVEELDELKESYKNDITMIQQLCDEGRELYGTVALMTGDVDMDQIHTLIHKLSGDVLTVKRGENLNSLPFFSFRPALTPDKLTFSVFGSIDHQQGSESGLIVSNIESICKACQTDTTVHSAAKQTQTDNEPVTVNVCSSEQESEIGNGSDEKAEQKPEQTITVEKVANTKGNIRNLDKCTPCENCSYPSPNYSNQQQCGNQTLYDNQCSQCPVFLQTISYTPVSSSSFGNLVPTVPIYIQPPPRTPPPPLPPPPPLNFPSSFTGPTISIFSVPPPPLPYPSLLLNTYNNCQSICYSVPPPPLIHYNNLSRPPSLPPCHDLSTTSTLYLSQPPCHNLNRLPSAAQHFQLEPNYAPSIPSVSMSTSLCPNVQQLFKAVQSKQTLHQPLPHQVFSSTLSDSHYPGTEKECANLCKSVSNLSIGKCDGHKTMASSSQVLPPILPMLPPVTSARSPSSMQMSPPFITSSPNKMYPPDFDRVGQETTLYKPITVQHHKQNHSPQSHDHQAQPRTISVTGYPANRFTSPVSGVKSVPLIFSTVGSNVRPPNLPSIVTSTISTPMELSSSCSTTCSMSTGLSISRTETVKTCSSNSSISRPYFPSTVDVEVVTDSSQWQDSNATNISTDYIITKISSPTITLPSVTCTASDNLLEKTNLTDTTGSVITCTSTSQLIESLSIFSMKCKVSDTRSVKCSRLTHIADTHSSVHQPSSSLCSSTASAESVFTQVPCAESTTPQTKTSIAELSPTNSSTKSNQLSQTLAWSYSKAENKAGPISKTCIRLQHPRNDSHRIKPVKNAIPVPCIPVRFRKLLSFETMQNLEHRAETCTHVREVQNDTDALIDTDDDAMPELECLNKSFREAGHNMLKIDTIHKHGHNNNPPDFDCQVSDSDKPNLDGSTKTNESLDHKDTVELADFMDTDTDTEQISKAASTPTHQIHTQFKLGPFESEPWVDIIDNGNTEHEKGDKGIDDALTNQDEAINKLLADFTGDCDRKQLKTFDRRNSYNQRNGADTESYRKNSRFETKRNGGRYELHDNTCRRQTNGTKSVNAQANERDYKPKTSGLQGRRKDEENWDEEINEAQVDTVKSAETVKNRTDTRETAVKRNKSRVLGVWNDQGSEVPFGKDGNEARKNREYANNQNRGTGLWDRGSLAPRKKGIVNKEHNVMEERWDSECEDGMNNNVGYNFNDIAVNEMKKHQKNSNASDNDDVTQKNKPQDKYPSHTTARESESKICKQVEKVYGLNERLDLNSESVTNNYPPNNARYEAKVQDIRECNTNAKGDNGKDIVTECWEDESVDVINNNWMKVSSDKCKDSYNNNVEVAVTEDRLYEKIDEKIEVGRDDPDSDVQQELLDVENANVKIETEEDENGKPDTEECESGKPVKTKTPDNSETITRLEVTSYSGTGQDGSGVEVHSPVNQPKISMSLLERHSQHSSSIFYISRGVEARLLFKCRASLNYPIGVVSNSHGEIIVADSGNDCMKVFDAGGQYLTTFGEKLSPALKRPSAVVVDEKNRIFVKDDHCIRSFQSDGTFVSNIGKDVLVKPFGLVLSRENKLIVLESGVKPRKLVHLSLDNAETDTYTYGPLVETKADKCRFMAIHEDRLIVSDLGSNKIYITDLEGNFIHSFGSYGTGMEQFYEPSGISVDNYGNMLIGDSKNNRVQIYKLDGTYLGSIKFDEKVNRPSDLHLTSDNKLLVVNFLRMTVKVYQLK